VRTPIEQTVRALDDLQQQGKTLYPAVSNWAAWQIATALGISAREGLARFELIQSMYNLVRRQAEVEILPWPGRSSASSLTAPLGGGLLTAKCGMVQIAPGDALAHLSRSVRCLG
jgi:aryl-alcohol dehydrogenase-like predicted oxidoreductase